MNEYCDLDSPYKNDGFECEGVVVGILLIRPTPLLPRFDGSGQSSLGPPFQNVILGFSICTYICMPYVSRVTDRVPAYIHT
jgi:hypothetical protein